MITTGKKNVSEPEAARDYDRIGPAQPILGAPRDSTCQKTIAVVKLKLAALSSLTGRRLLDVGCGEGSLTIAMSDGYAEVFGIDVETRWLAGFRRRVGVNPRFRVCAMSASAMSFPDDFFDTLITIETLEHVPDLVGSVREFYRVLRPGGECVLTCPNRLFPFENHGMRLGRKVLSTRIPLLPYLPPLHDRLSLARVFTVRRLDSLFIPLGFATGGLDYLWPTFEHGGNALQPLLKPLFGLMRCLEKSPVRMFGTSIVRRYLKPA